MQAAKEDPLIRKQIMLSDENIKKLSFLAKKNKTSMAHVVRNAIESFEPDAVNGDAELNLLVELLNEKLDDAINDTIATRAHLIKTLSGLSNRKVEA